MIEEEDTSEMMSIACWEKSIAIIIIGEAGKIGKLSL